MLGNSQYLVYAFGPSIEGQVVEGVVDGVWLYCSSDDVETVYEEMNVLYILM